jgi:hypothetical protein
MEQRAHALSREASLTGCRHRVEKGREKQKIETLEVSFP